MTHSINKQAGFALVLVLWILTLLTVMAGSFALAMRRESALVAGIKNNAEATAVAQSGITMSALMLLNPDQNKRWRADGSIYIISNDDLLGSEGAKVRVRLWSESGKIDLNKANQKLLASLMANAPIADEKLQLRLVGAIIDWRDPDDLLSIDGAEAQDYKAAGLRYVPRNKPFQTLSELQLVMGMDEAVYKWLLPLATVHSGQANVSLQYATREVLEVLPDMDKTTIDTYLAERLESNTKGLPPPPPPALVQSARGVQQAGQGLDSVGLALTVMAEAQLADGSSAVIQAMIKVGGDLSGTGQAYQVLDWQRNPVSNDSLFADTIAGRTISELLISP